MNDRRSGRSPPRHLPARWWWLIVAEEVVAESLGRERYFQVRAGDGGKLMRGLRYARNRAGHDPRIIIFVEPVALYDAVYPLAMKKLGLGSRSMVPTVLAPCPMTRMKGNSRTNPSMRPLRVNRP